MGSEFGEVLEGVEEHGDVLMVIFRFMSVCDGDFDKVSILLSVKWIQGVNTLALLASWRCLSYEDCARDLSISYALSLFDLFDSRV
jgi:hypothetical protein